MSDRDADQPDETILRGSSPGDPDNSSVRPGSSSATPASPLAPGGAQEPPVLGDKATINRNSASGPDDNVTVVRDPLSPADDGATVAGEGASADSARVSSASVTDAGDSAPDDSATVIRGGSTRPDDSATMISAAPGEPDNDSTLVRDAPAEPDNGATQIRDSAPEPDAATLIRGVPAESDGGATVVRGAPVQPERNRGSAALRDSNATVIRGAPALGSGAANPAASDQVVANNNQTVVRGGTGPVVDGDATVIRGASSPAGESQGRADAGQGAILRGSSVSANGKATILQPQSGPAADNTVLRPGSGAPASATILRPPVTDDGGDATVLRGTDASDAETSVQGEGDDRTVMNVSNDNDATAMGPGARRDSTQWKDAGRPVEPRGNTEAGRLLKNRFVLEEKVGSGGMGDVYKALDLRAQEAREKNPYQAIKILNESFARHKDAFISLQREASKTRQIPHKNIMGVYDFDKDGDTVYMSMELLDGEPLDDYLKNHPEGVSMDDALNIIDGYCQGLSRAHGAGIVHSDFKPGNIYYTKDKIAKVFDFGIARAVSTDLEEDGEKTVFDAGSLGALTPAYASLEMLNGKEPSKSDDVYAAALVAYELFTGKHPYNKVPANRALEQGLTPEPIRELKRRHWRALRKALELKGEDRTQTIDDFHEGMFSKDPPVLAYAAIAATILALAGFAGYQTVNEKEVNKEFLDTESRITFLDSSLKDQLEAGKFADVDWRTGVREDLFRMAQLEDDIAERWPLEERSVDVDLAGRKMSVLGAYIKRIQSLVDDARAQDKNKASVQSALSMLDEAQTYLEEVNTHYRFNVEVIDRVARDLATNLELRTNVLSQIEAAEDAADAAKRAQDREEARLAGIRQEQERRAAYYTNGLTAFQVPLRRCKREGNLTIAEIDSVSATMRNLGGTTNGNPERFVLDRPGMIAALAGCTRAVAVKKPNDARRIQSRLLALFPGETAFADIQIVDLDPCAKPSMEGRGSSKRGRCADKLVEGGNGPELVVIPGAGETISRFAMSQTEVRVSEWNAFCEKSGCARLQGSSSLPATRVDQNSVNAYLAWLTDQSGRTYRLPTVGEWTHAATAAGAATIDDNVNCTVKTLGYTGGETLSNVRVGRSNPWGLYNHIGNARELAVDGDQLVALGGAHTDPKEDCRPEHQVPHSGIADAVTGFRVVREI